MATKCPLCGAPMEEESCGYCGYKEKKSYQNVYENENIMQQESQYSQQENINVNIHMDVQNPMHGISKKKKTVALLLCIFLGAFGVHRFYVSKVGTGLIYLFTGGLFGIGWIVDIISIATGRFTDEFGLPLIQ